MKIFTNTFNVEGRNSAESTPLLGRVNKHNLCFHIEKDRWNFVDSPKDADIIPTLIHGPDLASFETQKKYIGEIRSNQMIVIMMHTHASEYVNNEVALRTLRDTWRTVTDKSILVSINSLSNDSNFIYYDFSFNFVKAYYTDYDRFDLKDRLWTGPCTKKSFVLSNIEHLVPEKKFLIPNNIRESREFKDHARKVLKDQIVSDIECFYSDPQNSKQFIPEENENPDVMLSASSPGGSIIPISTRYFTKSIISVYVETIGSGKYNVNAITEKSLIPLVQGHFILPFSYAGIIRDLKNMYGFKFPDWIDYSYDDIEDDLERLSKFIESINKLRQLSLQELADLANRDIDIRIYNRDIFFNRPYDSLYNKIHDRMKFS